ncbi:MAG: tRNA uridine(34) 5-carboxymethylaminomethyl modification radical SAM/GNAT enzyme Elp3, partial [Nitrososphaeraceae archaeon]|nr:tRNA uridine(34) 5-carboxymethylaminomethyl modification radical SAM/GNAT enzyme Elp3 [Nitrososphaeraceae archaeon]
LGIKCKCIRCREGGLQSRLIDDNNIIMNRIDYDASNGKEIFLSMESKDSESMLGFLRMRNTFSAGRKELKDVNQSIKNAVVIRELHVYGKLLDIGNKKNDESFQHRGLGKKLMKEAERIAREELNVKKISVISAIGTREYYKKMGYFINGPYVSKLV